MKKRVIFTFLICILFLQFITAETTFFEGELGYRDDFIVANLPEEVTGRAITEIPPEAGGHVQLNKTIVCDICFDSLTRHINKYRHINYSKEEIEFLRLEIKEETRIVFSPEQVLVLVENFDDECSRPYPLLGGFAGGRYSDILFPFITIVSLIILISLIILYFLFRRLRKVKFRKKSFKKPGRKKK